MNRKGELELYELFVHLKKIKCEDNSQNERLYLEIVYLIKV